MKAELAQSDGPGFAQSDSVDGGLIFAPRAATGGKARAWRSEIALDFAEMQGKSGDHGKAAAYFEHFGAAFSGNAQLTGGETERWGASLALPVGKATRISAKAEQLATIGIGRRTVATADAAQQLTPQLSLSLGVRHDDQAVGLIGNSRQSGARTDVAVQLGFAPARANWSLYGFGQLTADRAPTRQRNNRAGLGGKFEVSDRVSLSAEVSAGDGGLGANVELSHRYGSGSEAYLGYALTTDRTDVGLEPIGSLTPVTPGSFTIGARHRFTSALNIRAENKLGHGGPAPSLMRSFGLDWNPSERWSFTGSFERGHIDDVDTGSFKRTAATIGVGYTDAEVQVATNVEARIESGRGREQNVWLFRGSAAVEVTPDWRAIARLVFALADNDTTDVRAADYVEGTMGFAYRPILNDRLNVLARYTYLQDLGPVGQLAGGGQTAAPKQKSQILAIDANFDLTKTLTLGAKYGYREGRVSLSRESAQFVSSSTHLGVLRLDWRLVKQWDAVVEGHYLSADRAQDRRVGGIAALYRHLGNNVKLGAGYSFSDFSTDLADQSYSSKGFFINLLGKF
ncbi:MAG: hypothetical protein HC788_11710 [Sphingopyxis sp.]|nr:hypothetical protein [Sphingopyxis sp.]